MLHHNTLKHFVIKSKHFKKNFTNVGGTAFYNLAMVS
jgi:hypothetical protein